MLLRAHRLSAAVLLILAAHPANGAATAAPPSPRPSPTPPVFRQVIPEPTGRNGYEELVLAADALAESSQYRKAEQLRAENNLTLSFKRYVLLDPPVVRALALLRRGLAKPVFSPRASITAAPHFPELSQLLRLARLLQLQQYVHFADGRVSEAIGVTRLWMRLGQAVRTEGMITGLAGEMFGTLCITSLSAHLDQLAARDCELLYQVCLEWLRQPSSLPSVLEHERQRWKKRLEEVRGQDAATISDALDITDDDPDANDEESLRIRQVVKDLHRLDAAALATFLLQVAQEVDSVIDRQLRELKKSAWEQSRVRFPDDGSLAARFAFLAFTSVLDPVNDAYQLEEARIRMLACHAAIRRYRWEHDALPASLSQLNLGNLALDPFTGQPLQYQPRGTRYQLTSVGPVAGPEDSQAINGRHPVSVTPDDPSS